MTIENWLKGAILDAEARGLPALKPILETIARSTAALRAASESVEMESRADAEPPRRNGHDR